MSSSGRGDQLAEDQYQPLLPPGRWMLAGVGEPRFHLDQERGRKGDNDETWAPAPKPAQQPHLLRTGNEAAVRT